MMGSVTTIILCLAYIVGLLVAAIPAGGVIVLGLGIMAAWGIRRIWRTAPKPRIWLMAGTIALLATLYLHVRTPHPAVTDISRILPTTASATPALKVKVQGQILETPHLTRSQKMQVWLEVQQLAVLKGQPAPGHHQAAVTGKLYVTLPLLQATGLHPGQTIAVTGSLYKPQPATNFGGFDFQKYLAQQGCFAGLRGQQVDLPPQPTRWDWWLIQQRIARSQVAGAGSPIGQLIASIALGKQIVDLPFDIKDQFTRVGLAHALAASGTQVSLILGVVLTLSRRLPKRAQFAVGTIALLGFIGLAGAEPAILRAALMGFGGLIALLVDRRVKPLSLMLVVATLLLLWSPIWIYDLSFQFSFLATIGLLVSVPPLMQWLDWLPPTIASLIAIPLAATLWTLPVQLQTFSVLSTYSIVVNIITAPLISILGIGGIISALAALIWFPAGSAFAWILQFPVQLLLLITRFFAELPGSAYAIGTISAISAIVLYSLLALTWFSPWWRRRGWLAFSLGVIVLFVPMWQAKAGLLRVTILATTRQPVMVIQDGKHTTLINGGDTATVNFSVLPFLSQQGVNHLDWAIATTPIAQQPGWTGLLKAIPVQQIYTFSGAQPDTPGIPATTNNPLAKPIHLFPNQTIRLGSAQIQPLPTDPAIAQFTLHDQTWLWLGSPTTTTQKTLLSSHPVHPQVLWWSGKPLHPELIAALKPEVAIASATKIDADTANQFRQVGTQLYWTGQDGAIQWTPGEGFVTKLEASDKTS
ncbi:ComEC/Rec2 family competence protein [Pantanalinema rosaneae CENA516]|uniref:ComEC/Rec2 family competence protein n=1 Tax=Pantanalinema rosaneae TaxID=1620701 RepID=UPI003D6F3431